MRSRCKPNYSYSIDYQASYGYDSRYDDEEKYNSCPKPYKCVHFYKGWCNWNYSWGKKCYLPTCSSYEEKE